MSEPDRTVNFDEARDCSANDESASLANAIVQEAGAGQPVEFTYLTKGLALMYDAPSSSRTFTGHSLALPTANS
jgi:hypothetical protein